jgi:hypothetical protein
MRLDEVVGASIKTVALPLMVLNAEGPGRC